MLTSTFGAINDMNVQEFLAREKVNKRTPQQTQEWFRENGLTIASWSIEKGFNPALVYAVLQGKRKCLRGQSHQIALALGIKGS